MKGIVQGNVVHINLPFHLDDGTEVEIIPLNQFDPVCGSWQDDKSAEEIISDLRSTRYSHERSIDL